MENISERIIVVNREPDFIQNDETDFSANFIILCESSSNQRDEQLYKNSVCGLSIAEWVAMSCDETEFTSKKSLLSKSYKKFE